MLKHGRDTYYSVLYNQVVFKKNTFTSFCKILQNILFQNKIEHLHIDTNKLTFNGNHFNGYENIQNLSYLAITFAFSLS